MGQGKTVLEVIPCKVVYGVFPCVVGVRVTPGDAYHDFDNLLKSESDGHFAKKSKITAKDAPDRAHKHTPIGD